ncbi:MAG TPA: prolyl oligopeptidase family serine peptidase [Labilithrix sp.]
MRDRPNPERNDGKQRSEARAKERRVGASRRRRARGGHGRTLASAAPRMHHVFAPVFAALLGVMRMPVTAIDHEDVEGPPIATLDLDGVATPFADLENERPRGTHTLRFAAHGEAVWIPHCAGRGRVLVDGAVRDRESKGPLVARLEPGDHTVEIEVTASAYEKRIACGAPPRAGRVTTTDEGTTLLRFASPHAHADAGRAVLVVPRGHDRTIPSALLVGVHPWNGGPWTYAAYRELVDEAQREDVVLLMPSGLGNSLYTADAEDEVLRAIDAAERAVSVDPQRVSIWGASMGGAGATTIGFHHPDRFAFVASYFGDSKYDLTTYVKSLIPDEAAARKVNALDVLDNARWLPVLLVHGEADATSPIRQSTMLFDAMKRAGFDVELERVAGMGHEGALVAKYLRRVVDRASAAIAPVYPARVSYRSFRSIDLGAYGVTFERASTEGEAFVDVEKRADGIHVLAKRGVRAIHFAPGALGAKDGEAVHDETETR